jgi:hypothetical protein
VAGTQQRGELAERVAVVVAAEAAWRVGGAEPVVDVAGGDCRDPGAGVDPGMVDVVSG